jgi:nucleoside-diphosphate-sugar epimerase
LIFILFPQKLGKSRLGRPHFSYFYCFEISVYGMKTQPIESALVTGGCGSLGHGIVKRLLKIQPPIPISVFDLNTKPNRFPGVQYYEVDITDRNKVNSELSKVKPQVILHTASPPAGLLDLQFYMKVNVEGTRNLLESAKVRILYLPFLKDQHN